MSLQTTLNHIQNEIQIQRKMHAPTTTFLDPKKNKLIFCNVKFKLGILGLTVVVLCEVQS